MYEAHLTDDPCISIVSAITNGNAHRRAFECIELVMFWYYNEHSLVSNQCFVLKVFAFYGTRKTRFQDIVRLPVRLSYIVPSACSDSDIEVEDEMLDEDDDVLDPDFQLNLPDDLIPTSSGNKLNNWNLLT